MRLDDNIQLVSEIGSGGMGAVWRAHHDVMKKDVAVKLLHKRLATPDRLLRFRKEAQLASSLKHPNIVQVYSFGKNDDLGPFIVMELIEGESLEQRLQRGTLAVDEFTNIFSQCCRGLQHAHEAGVIHRDIKPANIMLVDDKAGGVIVKIGDFGIAKFIDETRNIQHLTQTGEIIGTPLYISPEACSSEPLDARSDIYSLGCVMYHAAAGKPPFSGDNAVEVMMQHVEGKVDPRPLANLPMGLRAIILVSLSRQPQDRQQTMTALREDIEQGKPSKRKMTRSGARSASFGVGKMLVVALGLIVIGLSAYTFCSVTGDKRPGGPPSDQQLLDEAEKWKSESRFSRAGDCYKEIYHDANLDLLCQLGPSGVQESRMRRKWTDGEIEPIVAAVQRLDNLHNLPVQRRDVQPWQTLNSILVKLLNRDMWKFGEGERLSEEQRRVQSLFALKAAAIANCKEWKAKDAYPQLMVASDLLFLNGVLYYRSHLLAEALSSFEQAGELRERASRYIPPDMFQPHSEISCYEGEILSQLGYPQKARVRFAAAADTLAAEQRVTTMRALDSGEGPRNYGNLRHRIYGGLNDSEWLCGRGSEACAAMRKDLQNSKTSEVQADLERERACLVEAEALLGDRRHALRDMGAIGGVGPLKTDPKSISNETTNVLAKQALALSLCGQFDQSAAIVSEIDRRSIADRVESTIDNNSPGHLRKLLALLAQRYAKALNSEHAGQFDSAVAAYEDAIRIGSAALRKLAGAKQQIASSDVTTALILHMVARDYGSLLTKHGQPDRAKLESAKVVETCHGVPDIDSVALSLLKESAKTPSRE